MAIAATSARAATPCQMQELAELPVIMQGNFGTVDATINGKPVRMMLDTGSDQTLLFRGAAKELGLALRHMTGMKFYGAGGSDEAMTARLTSFRVGALSEANQDVYVVGRGDFGGVQGVLGARFLTQADVEFDFSNGKLRFFKPKNCEGDQVVYWGTAYSVTPMRPTVDQSIQINVVINGVTLQAEMESGASMSVLTPEAAARTGVTPRSRGVASDGKTSGLGAEKVDVYVGVFPTFAFGDETIRNARLRIADLFRADKERTTDSNIPVAVVDEPRMLLGADFFRSHRIYISRQQHKVYASYVGGPVFQTEAPADEASY